LAKVIVLSGAGISAESGIETFRDSNGLWEKHNIEEVCSSSSLTDNRNKTIDFYDTRRSELKNKKPNRTHIVLTKLKKKYRSDIAIITQNVDNLFEKAGLKSDEITHLHGLLTDAQCEECNLIYDIGYSKLSDKFNGKCPNCKSLKLRPHVVMFGEKAPMYDKLYEEIKDCTLLVVIGTSGSVINVDSFTPYIKKSILNNLEPSKAIFDKLYTKVLYKKATEAIDEIALNIEKELRDSVKSLTESLIEKTLNLQSDESAILTFNQSVDRDRLYSHLSQIIKREENLTESEFNTIITNLIVEFKNRRDNKLKTVEKREHYNKLLCFFVNEFNFNSIYEN